MKIIVVVGPTAVGKTKASIELAKKYHAEIINADSTIVYRGMNVGTAKPSSKEMEGIKHHLIDIKDLFEEYTVYDYQKDARQLLDKFIKENKNVIIVGGSGLYLSSLLYDYNFKEGSNIYDFDSLSDEEMYKKLKEVHPELEIDKHNRNRLIRAYAKYINQSEPITKETSGENLVYDAIIVGLTTPRDNLYTRINKRVEDMIESDLIKEVRNLYNKYPDSKMLKTTIGYKETVDYIDNKISLEDMIVSIKQNSRNLAKRQYTWFNHKMNIKWFETNFNDFSETITKITNYIDNAKEK